jgi:hypothetical protein
MKARSRYPRLSALLLMSVGVILGFALVGSAFAGPTEPKDLTSYRQQTVQNKLQKKKIVYYVLSSVSAIPIPIEWVEGAVPTTAIPMQIIGRRDHISR